MKKIVEGIEALNEFLEPMLKGEFVVGAKEIEPNKFEVQWEVRKKYIAHDGKEFLDEAWMTEDGQMIQIQDLTEAHAKNILRMILRQRRESERALAAMEKLFQAMEAGDADALEELNDTPVSTITGKPMLH